MTKMSFTGLKYTIAILFMLLSQGLIGQESPLTEAYKKEVIDQLSTMLNDFYIYPDVANKTGEHLLAQFDTGHFDRCRDPQSFAEVLTETVQAVNKDKHMRIMANRPGQAPVSSLKERAVQRMDQINNYRAFNHGFYEAKLLEGNVGYLDIRGFAGMERGKEMADAAMRFISQADAVVIDLRQNGGGNPAMVQYICSYFFADSLHLNSLYYREGDRTEEYWTLNEVGGKKMDKVPLYVIISDETFSGAEEFAYNMQTQQRATLVGQTSAGAANPGGTRGINSELAVFIPTGRAINPITQTSWEGTGVIPEVKTEEGEAFDKAFALAQKAAEQVRTDKVETYIRLHKALDAHLVTYVEGESEGEIEKSIATFVKSRLFGEWDVNMLGYKYLRELNKPNLARCILKSNTVLFPNSPNVFDSYGEVLRSTGDVDGALESYQRAVDVATKTGSRNLAYHQDVLRKVQEEMKQGR